MLIDTHCHLDAAAFDADRSQVIGRAQAAGVAQIVIPAVNRASFAKVQALAARFAGGAYALGIHPLFVAQSSDDDLDALADCLEQARDDPRLVAIGEIGLDFFVREMATPARRARQIEFYVRQLALARAFDLPVLLHARRSHDIVLKYLRRHPDVGGIAHAFNGSFQQAGQFIEQGFALGFGGVMTFNRARQIRRLAVELPLSALVLETDAPDLPPAWLGEPGRPPARNEPAEVAGVCDCLAQLRGMDPAQVSRHTTENAHRVLPRLP